MQSIKVGKERTNCYVVSVADESIIIDPGAEAEKIFPFLSNSSKLLYILLTHGHFDHVGAVDEIKRLYPGVSVFIHEADIALYRKVPEQGIFVGELLPQPKSELTAVSDGEFLPFGEEEIEVIATPGHTPGGVCFRLGGYLFTGDTLFYHTIGRTDLPFSNEIEMKLSLDRLSHLDCGLRIFPGHGKETTIQEELENNPYL